MEIFLQDFANYFDKNIDKDIKRMGIWTLQRYSVKLFTDNQSESFNAAMKRHRWFMVHQQ